MAVVVGNHLSQQQAISAWGLYGDVLSLTNLIFHKSITSGDITNDYSNTCEYPGEYFSR